MKDVKELSSLVADMVCKSLEQIIDENISPDAIVNTCKIDSEFKDSLIEKLSQAFPVLFQGDTRSLVVNYLIDVDRPELFDILNESCKINDISEELQEDIVNDYFEDSDGSDIWERCSYRQQDDIREEISDDIYNDAIDDAISALEDKRR